MIRSGAKHRPFSALALAASTVALPAAAEGWDALEAPAKLSQGQPYCLLWLGETSPMVNITVLESRQALAIQAQALVPVQDKAPGSLTFPSGETTDLGSVTKHGADMVFFTLKWDRLDEVCGLLSVDGQFTASAAGQSVSFPTTGIAPAIARMKTCLTHDLRTPPS